MFGALLIILGVFFIAQEAGWISGSFWGYSWGILLILIGVNIIRKKKSGL